MVLKLVIFCLFGMLLSCSEKQAVIKEYECNYFVTQEKFIGDSIIQDATVEYFAKVELKGNVCQWKKRIIQRELEHSEKLLGFYVVDSIQFGFVVNSDFEVQKFLGWDELYNRVKKETDKIIESTPKSRREEMTFIINKLSLDSSAIVNKVSQDAQVFNLGLQFLFNEGKMEQEGYKILREIGYRKLIINSSSLMGIPPLQNLVKKSKDFSENIKYDTDIEIVKNIKESTIKSLIFVISFLDENGVRVYIRTTMAKA